MTNKIIPLKVNEEEYRQIKNLCFEKNKTLKTLFRENILNKLEK
jgi:hypothetical protein